MLFKSLRYSYTIIKRTIHTTKMNKNIGKQAAAYRAVDECITQDTKIIGIGSGSTIVFAVERIKQRMTTENLNIICIPTSYQAQQLITDNGLQLGTLEIHPKLDCVIDGADEVDSELVLIKGGGACLLQEKIVASCTDNMIVVADATKNSVKLGQTFKYIPIEVLPIAWKPVKNKILKFYGGTIQLHDGISKAGPCITDNGNFLLKWYFPLDTEFNWRSVNTDLLMIPGIIDHGLFCNMAKKVYFGEDNGNVIIKP